VAAEADLPDDIGIAVEPKRLVDKRRGGTRWREIHEHAVRAGDPFFVERDLAVKLDPALSSEAATFKPVSLAVNCRQ